MFKKVIKNTSLVSVGNFISMFLGLIRDIMIANFFGTSVILEAFIVSFRIPNLFRSALGEGFAQSVATPVLSEYRKDKEKLFEAGGNLLCLLSAVLLVIALFGVIFSKYCVMIIAPGFLDNPAKFDLTVSFTRITFFYLFFIGLSVNISAILSTMKKFFIPAVTPAFLNISFIVGVTFFTRFAKDYTLVVCVLVAGVLQLIFPFFFLRAQGFTLRFNLKAALKDKVVMRMLKMFPPRLISSIVYHLSVLIDTAFSSLTVIVGSGALAAIWYAQRFIHFPLAIIAIPISSVAIVDLSHYHSEGRLDDFKKLFVFSFNNIAFFALPIVFAYIFFSKPIIDVLFKRGGFDAYSSEITSWVLFFYSFGLFFFCVIKLLVNCFYSLKDTMTPAKVTFLALLMNIALSAILMFPLKIGGVALGSSIAAVFNCIILYRHLVKKIGKVDWQDTRSQIIKILFLSFVVAASARFLWDILTFQKYFKAAIVLMSWAAMIFVGGNILGLKQIQYIKEKIVKSYKS